MRDSIGYHTTCASLLYILQLSKSIEGTYVMNEVKPAQEKWHGEPITLAAPPIIFNFILCNRLLVPSFYGKVFLTLRSLYMGVCNVEHMHESWMHTNPKTTSKRALFCLIVLPVISAIAFILWPIHQTLNMYRSN